MGIWKRFKNDLSDVSGLLVCAFGFVLHMSCYIPSSVSLFYLANVVPRGGLRMFDGQGPKIKKKRYQLYAVGHQRAESRDTFVVKKGHFTMFCPQEGHFVMSYLP